jgi:hypothetical protein
LREVDMATLWWLNDRDALYKFRRQTRLIPRS